MSFDLHTHSRCSDGTDTPAEVVHQAAAAHDAGLLGIALTDHDTVAGWSEAQEAAQMEGVTLVRGTEVSCESGRITVHILSYLHRPDDAALAAELDRSRASRLGRAERMVDSLAMEYPISWEQVKAQVAPGATVGRPHIADALVAAGAFAHRDDAFASALSISSPHYVPYYAPDPLTTISLIRAAGGVPVLAHGLARSRGRVLAPERIEEMAQAGLAGLEVHHREHGEDERAVLLELARRYDLIVTGSSDFHGTGKQNRLGENRTELRMLQRIEEQGALDVLWAG